MPGKTEDFVVTHYRKLTQTLCNNESKWIKSIPQRNLGPIFLDYLYPFKKAK